MMNALKIIFVLTTVIFLYGCKKVKFPDSQSEQLIGKWKYVTSSGGNTGSQENSSKSEIEFTKHGKYKYKDKDPSTFSKKYKVELEESIYSGTVVYIIKYSSNIPKSLPDASQAFEIIGNKLYLSDEAYDAFSYVYERK